MYEEHVSKFKTGDLILYDAHGLLPSYVKLASNSPYSNVGMVIKLPNRWTRKPELYVAGGMIGSLLY